MDDERHEDAASNDRRPGAGSLMLVPLLVTPIAAWIAATHAGHALLTFMRGLW